MCGFSLQGGSLVDSDPSACRKPSCIYVHRVCGTSLVYENSATGPTRLVVVAVFCDNSVFLWSLYEISFPRVDCREKFSFGKNSFWSTQTLFTE